jgi:hypothetical protein
MATVTMAPKLVLFLLNSSSLSFAFQIEDALQLRLILTLREMMHHTETMLLSTKDIPPSASRNVLMTF